MKRALELFTNIIKTLNPLEYKKLIENSLKRSFSFFVIIIFLGVLISGALCIPKMFGNVNSIRTILNKTEEIRLNPVIKTAEPVLLNNRYHKDESVAYFIMDTSGKYNASQSEIFIDSDFIYYNNGNKRKTLEEVFDIKQYEDKISTKGLWLLVLLIPSLFVIYVIGSLLFFAVLIFLLSIIGYTISKFIFKRKTGLGSLLNIGFYASVFLSFAMIASALKDSLGLYLFWVFILYYIVAYVQILGKNHGKTHKKHKKRNLDED